MIVRAAALALLAAWSADGAGLTDAQQRGKQLYLTGESVAKRPVTALLGADDVEVAAGVVPCASCHARDGRGRAEGGIRPSNIQWDALRHAAATDERARDAYTRPLLKRAITMGLDSSAKKLQDTMPRYRMAVEDIEDLLSYLEILGGDREPGISDDAVRVGVVLPADPNEQAAVRKTLSAYFERLNGGGGIYGRRLDARFTSAKGTPEQRAAALAGFLESEQPFAIAAAWMSGADVAMSEVAEKAHVPTIAAFSAHAPPDDRYVFRLLAGVREQSLALLAAAKPEADTRIAVIADDAGAGTAEQVLAAYPGAKIVQSVPADAELVLFLGAASRLGAVLDEAAALPSPPRVLIPAAHSSGNLTAAPAALDGRIFVALPSSPDDVTEAGLAELRALDVQPAHATACRLALASARLMVEALRLIGRDLQRDALVSTLEGFHRAPTSLTPPVTWAPNQHTGTRTARIMSVDLREKRWVDRGWH
ncbi:MAG TPA: ABC transporter substrate-binding protein [Thermoanaerobaculia bacterium]